MAGVIGPTAPLDVLSSGLIRLLAGIAVLLFVGRAVLPRGRGRYAWAKWGAIAAFSAAVSYTLGLTLLWAFGASR
jgi:hypothetical protein